MYSLQKAVDLLSICHHGASTYEVVRAAIDTERYIAGIYSAVDLYNCIWMFSSDVLYFLKLTPDESLSASPWLNRHDLHDIVLSQQMHVPVHTRDGSIRTDCESRIYVVLLDFPDGRFHVDILNVDSYSVNKAQSVYICIWVGDHQMAVEVAIRNLILQILDILGSDS